MDELKETYGFNNNNNNKSKILNKITKLKVYFGRSAMYISLINFVLILSNFKLLYELKINLYLFIFACFSLTLIIGYVDYKIILNKEFEYVNKQNDIKTQLDEIKEMLSK